MRSFCCGNTISWEPLNQITSVTRTTLITVAAIASATVFHAALCRHPLIALSDACVCVVSPKIKGSLTAGIRLKKNVIDHSFCGEVMAQPGPSLVLRPPSSESPATHLGYCAPRPVPHYVLAEWALLLANRSFTARLRPCWDML